MLLSPRNVHGPRKSPEIVTSANVIISGRNQGSEDPVFGPKRALSELQNGPLSDPNRTRGLGTIYG